MDRLGCIHLTRALHCFCSLLFDFWKTVSNGLLLLSASILTMDNQANNDTAENPFHSSLVQQILQSSVGDGSDNKMYSRLSEEALVAAGEVMRLFVQEAWHRASIEAECDHEGTMRDNDDGPAQNSKTVGPKMTSSVPIRPDHVTKIAAELLMDFS
jgi:CENP-S associating Centromere protein X